MFTYVAKGLMNKQIAHKMGISLIMTKIHRGRMMRKLRVRTIADLVRLYDEVQVSSEPSPGATELTDQT